ncbi:hypothetical protein K0U91_15275 [Chryseobacterium chendengshani]|uniref:hypothetical protein n=1 Tax=Chryseobacterium sp. LJ668 TaxID=2864040 RepID=UPI001C691AAE|nr:hypothetical protein [Chryseobacterium sp. LJ668]MBW8522870.1 hypothetical protein [Chryseobacterium sp. LJ668]QYK16400.1 hypothetical protein K0U91_15275 [Chryseobacterium sp. LJ668]
MVQKYFFISIMLMGLTLISCRQSEELSTNEEVTTNVQNITAKDKGNENPSEVARDSTDVNLDPNDPPKSGTHWKIKK